MSKSVKRVCVHVAALCVALVGIYAFAGFIVLPYWIERKLPELRASIGADVSVDELAINPFLLTATLSGLAVARNDEPPVLHAQVIHIDLSIDSVVRRGWIVDALEIRRPRIELVRDADGSLNANVLQASSAQGGTSDASPAEGSATRPPAFLVRRISIQGGSFQYLDRAPLTPRQFTVGPFVLDAENVGTLTDNPGAFRIRTALPDEGSARAQGSVALWPIASAGTFHAEGIGVAKLGALAMNAGLIEPPQGRLDLSLRYRFGAGDGDVRLTFDGLTASLTDLSLRKSGAEEPMVDLASLSIAGGSLNYGERVLALHTVALRGGRIAGHLDARRRLDLADIATAFAPEDPDPPAASRPWQVAVSAFRIDELQFSYSDATGGADRAARIDNSTIRLSGTASLGPERVDAQMRDIEMNLQGVHLGGPKTDSSLQLASLHLQGGFADSRTRQVAAAALDLSDGTLSLRRDAEGNIAFPGVDTSEADAPERRARNEGALKTDTAPDTGKPPLPGPWQVDAKHLRLNRIALRYTDQASQAPLSLAVARIEAASGMALTVATNSVRVSASDLRLGLNGIALSAMDEEIPAVTLKMLTLTGGRFDTASRAASAASLELDGLRADVMRNARGILSLSQSEKPRDVPAGSTEYRKSEADAARSEAAWHVHITKVSGQVESVRYVDLAATPAFTAALNEATFGFALDFDIGDAPRLVVDALNARLAGASFRTVGGSKTAELGRIAIEQGGLDTGSRRIVAQSVMLADGKLPLVRTDRGATTLAGFPLAAGMQRDADAPAPPEAEAWQYEVARLHIENVGLALVDQSYASEVAYDLNINGSARDLGGGHDGPIKLDATARFAQGGSIRAEGTVEQSFTAGTFRLEANDLALTPLTPLLESYAYLAIASGMASGAVQVQMSTTPERPRLQIKGDLQLADVIVNETGTSQSVVSWQMIDARQIAIDLDPNRIEIAEVRVSAPQAELTISKEHTLSWSRLIRDDVQATSDVGQRWQDVFPIRIGRISIAKGQMQFADLSLVLPFSTRIVELRGAVVGLSSAADARAELELTGSIADYGSASARGGLNAFDPTSFMDIEAKFENVLIPPFSPYTATFAGRAIESGRLWLDLEYRVIDRQLAGQNSISVQNLELGERIQAPNAADLPLELAVALLEDDQGRINLNIPVTGNVGDPQFDYGTIIARAIGSTIRRIVGAPFRALASLFGGGDAEDVRRIRFQPGEDDLRPAERQQLAQVAKALHARPGLRLLVRGPYDPVRDGQALREQQMRRAVSAALGRPADVSAPADPIALTDPPTQNVLEKMLVKRLSESDYRAFKQISGPSDPQYYIGMLAELSARIDIDERQLRLLAANRARSIASALVDSGISPDRIASFGLRVADGDPHAVAATLELDAGVLSPTRPARETSHIEGSSNITEEGKP